MIRFQDLDFQKWFLPEYLSKLDTNFLEYLKNFDEKLYQQIIEYRYKKIFISKQHSQLLINCSIVLESFLINFFDIKNNIDYSECENFIFFKKNFVQIAKKNSSKKEENFFKKNIWLSEELIRYDLQDLDRETAVWHYARCITRINDEEAHQKLLSWCIEAVHTEAGSRATQDWISFRVPKRVDPNNRICFETQKDQNGNHYIDSKKHIFRDGFQLMDYGINKKRLMYEVNYCIYCHKSETDFCSKGFLIKKNDPDSGFKKNTDLLTGCPLEEHISEMHFLKKSNQHIAALAVVMINNPLCPATGRRICNDCTKSCIYQKQDPVHIPEIETRVLEDVLSLKWGVELYDLLTRWNPLRHTQWCAQPFNGSKIWIVGTGPAGFTLAHHLLMEGCAVLATDGLKIEPLPMRYTTQPILYFSEIEESLETRCIWGFGGVSEYGITVRWNKNFLKLIYISLMRRPYFQLYGDLRLGGAFRIEDAWHFGFHHVALAVGAGLPKTLSIPHGLAPGVRQASDFLMTLQSSGAFRSSSLVNLQIRFPVVVVGGGLTGVDAATEAQAYYIRQVEKIAYRYSILVAHYGIAWVRNAYEASDWAILDEFLEHAHWFAEERREAAQMNRSPQWIPIVHRLGGVTIVYRRNIYDAPAYTHNAEELQAALDMGIFYRPDVEPKSIVLDEIGWAVGMRCVSKGTEFFLKARTVLIATGSVPNMAYEYEHRGNFARNGIFYQNCTLDSDHELHAVLETGHCKSKTFGPFTTYSESGRHVSVLGDLHPHFHGSVVKAMASARASYEPIAQDARVHAQKHDTPHTDSASFQRTMRALCAAHVVQVHRKNEKLVQLSVRAPMAARHFRPGQFYRVQNYEYASSCTHGTRLQSEPVALLGCRNERDEELLSFWIWEQGASTRLLSRMQVGDPISVMGPTGVGASVHDSHRHILVIGSELSAIYLCAVAQTFKQHLNRITWIAQDNAVTRSLHPEFHQYLQKTHWLKTWDVFSDWAGSDPHIKNTDRVVVVGEPNLLRTMSGHLYGPLRPLFPSHVVFLGSVYGFMQCMLKGICASCLQWQINPKTQERTKAVYSCSWQEQELNCIDIDHIQERLVQNRTQEILSNQWLTHILNNVSP